MDVETYGFPEFVKRVLATKAKKKMKALILFKPLLRTLQQHTLETTHHLLMICDLRTNILGQVLSKTHGASVTLP